jgi:hypothetical protein
MLWSGVSIQKEWAQKLFMTSARGCGPQVMDVWKAASTLHVTYTGI